MRWLVGQTTYEGDPLLLRRPADLDINSLRPRFSNLAVITHELEIVCENGLPEREYNDSLADLDHDIVTAIDSSLGTIVLVETYSGERHYYFYVSETVTISNIAESIVGRYPGTKLTTFSKHDRDWNFLANYAKDFDDFF
jgi:hypothetical protein